MTDQPSSQSQPSMEDILASIRRIIDDEDVKPSAPASAVPPVPKPQENASSFEVDEDAAAQARAEYDAAMAETHTLSNNVDPSSESIFPQRDGALWRRVAGHPLSEGETDPLPADETFELTEMLEDESELELTEFVDSAADSDPDEDARLLNDVAASESAPTDDSAIGIGAMTAAGVGAVGVSGVFAGSTMDRVTERMAKADSVAGSVRHDDDDDDEVLDLTRSIDSDASIDELASSMADTPNFESVKMPRDADMDDDIPMPVFERVEVPSNASNSADAADEGDLDDTFEAAAVTGLTSDYSASLSDKNKDGDAHERALDDRFYNADEFDDQPPEITDDYASSLGGEVKKLARSEGAPKEDEMETVGGLVRDALRGRLPAAPVKPAATPDNTPLVSDGAESSAARSLATLARYDAHAPRRIYGGIKITDDDDSPTIEGMVQDTLRPMLRDWLNDNLPTLVENMVKQEVDRISARSRRFVREDED